MAKRMVRRYEPEQPVAGPADLREWLPPDHPVYLLGDLVDALDLTPITAVYDQGDGGGNPPYHPVLLTKLLLYAYCQGVVSSRQIAAKTYEDVAFRVLTTDQHPDFRTISDFRERHLAALTALFGQVVRLAQRVGLVRLQHVAQDGTKVLANASKHRAMSYARMAPAEARLAREIAALLAAARATDAAEDATDGPARPGDEVPEALAAAIGRRERRRATIRAAQAALEAEAQAAAAATVAADVAARARRAQAGQPKKPGKPPTPPGTPAAKAQRNFTDPDSRIMKNADQAFVQAYNGQAAVDGSGHQIIVGCLLTNQAADAPHLVPMVAQVQATSGQTPDEWSADCGYFSAENVAVLEGAGSLALIPPDRQATAGPVLPSAVAQVLTAAGLGSATEAGAMTESAVKTAMRARLRTDRGQRAYARRKQTVEPVFGQIKERQGLRRFGLRGLAKVTGEWTLWCLTHNLRRIVHALRADPNLRQHLVGA
jgi:transposase